MKTKYCIISHDRHRDDRIYTFEAESKEEIKIYMDRVWNKDFGYKPYRENEYSVCGDDSGDYYIELTRPIEL